MIQERDEASPKIAPKIDEEKKDGSTKDEGIVMIMSYLTVHNLLIILLLL